MLYDEIVHEEPAALTGLRTGGAGFHCGSRPPKRLVRLVDLATHTSGIGEYSRCSGVPSELRSCHTAIIDGYTIEGHVPAADIQRLLSERPEAKGLVVPGMPIGFPGMEGGRRQAYSVLLFGTDGQTSVFQDYPA